MNCENCGSGVSENEPHVTVCGHMWYHEYCYEADADDTDVEYCS